MQFTILRSVIYHLRRPWFISTFIYYSQGSYTSRTSCAKIPFPLPDSRSFVRRPAKNSFWKRWKPTFLVRIWSRSSGFLGVAPHHVRNQLLTLLSRPQAKPSATVCWAIFLGSDYIAVSRYDLCSATWIWPPDFELWPGKETSAWDFVLKRHCSWSIRATHINSLQRIW